MGPDPTNLPGQGQTAGALFGGQPETSRLPTSGGAPSLGDFLKGLPQVTNEDIQKALSPTMQRGPMQMPSAFTTPHSQILPPAEMNRQPVVGAGNARAQGIGNSVSAVVRTLGNYKAKRDLVKQEADATRVERLIQAQYGVDKAEEQLKQLKPGDPGYEQAKQSLDHNKNVMSGMFQDPKFVKTVEKGFQISLTDPSQNKTPDHNIVQRGIALFKKNSQQPFSQEQAAGMAQKFQAAQPAQLAPNQIAQQQLQMKMQQQKLGAEVFKTYVPLMVQQARFSNAQMMQNAREAFQSQMKYADATKAFALARFNAEKQMALQDRLFNKQFTLEAMRQRGRIDLLNKRVAASGGDGLKVWKAIQDENKIFDAEKKEREAKIAAYEGQINQLMKSPDFKAKDDNPVQQRINQIRDTIDGPNGLRKGFEELDRHHAQSLATIQSFLPKDDGESNAGSNGEDSGSSSGDSDSSFDAQYNKLLRESEGSSEDFDPASDDYSQYVSPH